MPDRMFHLILAQVRLIPHGKVATYGDVAYAAGFPGAARQVVWALRSTHGLPWHRVVGSGGKILLPGEQGFEQRMRLQAEGVQFHGQRIAMETCHHSFFSHKKKAAAKSKRATTATKAASRKRTTSSKRTATKKSALKKRWRP